MSNVEIVDTIRDIVIDIFDIDDPDSIELTIDSKIEDYPQWDSLAHINIITQIEAIYSIRFSLEEIEEFEYISVIVQFIASKIQH
jgi:acyl carrier protein